MKLIIVATSNKNKVKEIASYFSNTDITVLPVSILKNVPLIVEDGSTFAQNSQIKAKAIAEIFSCAVIADDSGLIIDALNGEPGVFSARYMNLNSDDEKNNAVLNKMQNVPDELRTARFTCAISFITPTGEVFSSEESCEGIITKSKSGNCGFGYDPIFFLPQYNKTMAEISLDEKNVISHRGKALQKISKEIIKWFQK